MSSTVICPQIRGLAAKRSVKNRGKVAYIRFGKLRSKVMAVRKFGSSDDLDAASKAALKELERRGQADLISRHEQSVQRLMEERARERENGRRMDGG